MVVLNVFTEVQWGEYVRTQQFIQIISTCYFYVYVCAHARSCNFCKIRKRFVDYSSIANNNLYYKNKTIIGWDTLHLSSAVHLIYHKVSYSMSVPSSSSLLPSTSASCSVTSMFAASSRAAAASSPPPVSAATSFSVICDSLSSALSMSDEYSVRSPICATASCCLLRSSLCGRNTTPKRPCSAAARHLLISLWEIYPSWPGRNSNKARIRLSSSLLRVFFLPDRPEHTLVDYDIGYAILPVWLSCGHNPVRLHVCAWLAFCIFVRLDFQLCLPRGVAASDGGLLPPLPPGWRPPLPPAAVLPRHTVRRLRARRPTRKGAAAGVAADVLPALAPDEPPPGALWLGRSRVGAVVVDMSKTEIEIITFSCVILLLCY